MEKLTLGNIASKLNLYDKIIVTGPPRSGTTVAGMVIADELEYKFIDESFYDANNSQKFMFFLHYPDRKLVVHTTAFLRDLCTISHFLSQVKACIVLVERKIKDILESFENSKNFKMGCHTSNGLFMSIDEEAQEILLNHYGKKGDLTLPEIIYECFRNQLIFFVNSNVRVFRIKYEDLENHKLFVKKEVRRKNFKHIKQVKIDDPYYLQKQVMIL
jgi:hypothetical protein